MSSARSRLRSVLLTIGFVAAAAALVGAGPAKPPRVPHPEGYRDWTHVNTMAMKTVRVVKDGGAGCFSCRASRENGAAWLAVGPK